MDITQYLIPIPDYYGDKVFKQQLFVESDRPISKFELLAVLQRLHKEESPFQEYPGTWDQCARSVEACFNFPILSGLCVGANGWVDVQELFQIRSLRVPLTAKKITIQKLA